MKKPPENLTLGHATAYVLLYVVLTNLKRKFKIDN